MALRLVELDMDLATAAALRHNPDEHRQNEATLFKPEAHVVEADPETDGDDWVCGVCLRSSIMVQRHWKAEIGLCAGKVTAIQMNASGLFASSVRLQCM